MKIFALGRKGNDSLRRDMREQITGTKNFVGKKVVTFADAEEVAQEIIRGFKAGEYDVVTLMFNRFHNVMTQKPFEQPLIPAAAPTANDNAMEHNYEVEPDDGTLLDRLLPRNLAVQIYAASAGKRSRLLCQPDDRDGQRHPQRWPDDQETDAQL